jgi:hypothetical protein
MNALLTDVSATQLRKAASIKDRINELENELRQILGTTEAGHIGVRRKRRMSAAGRRAIAAGARARWAKIKGVTTKPAKRKRKMSAATKARLSAIAKARWKKTRTAGKNTL